MTGRVARMDPFAWFRWGVTLAALLSGLTGCQEPPEALPVRSLVASGDVSYLCRTLDGEGTSIRNCPDFETQQNQMFALVTQTLTAELAVINLTAGEVIDVDHSSPGFTFLRIGQNPVDVVSTPGGVASFVGVAEVGAPGIYGIPTRCIEAPTGDETRRDRTTWPACSLPTAPGEMAILIDPADEEGGIRETCDSDPVLELPEPLAGSSARECQADLRRERRDPGRRKLAVALPAFGEIAILDAQEILDRAPGSFSACHIERTVPLDIDLPSTTIEQRVPADLEVPGCTPAVIEYSPVAGDFTSRPAGFAESDGTLYVADQGGPVVHRLDVRDPCNVREGPPLLPRSLYEPGRVVTTTKVAASPPTTSGDRFVYAIDEFGRTAANVMVFDVTPGQTERTPLVRPGTPYLPFEPADRIAFAAPAQDLAFARRDLPLPDPNTGEAIIGTRCNPDPSVDTDSPAALYRPNAALTQGAAPDNLRGLFGFVLLTNGQVAVVDVEDYDAQCRRPETLNTSEAIDFRGCAGDPSSPDFYTLDGDAESPPTVSNEVSCRVVEQHRGRAGRYIATGGQAGVGAPSLRTFPKLSLDGRSLPMNQTDAGVQYPKILAVDFENPAEPSAPEPAQVYVGTTLYSSVAETGEDTLKLDPKEAERGSVALPWVEPRAYPTEDHVTVTYEGAVTGVRSSGFLKVGEAEFDSLEDASARFCDSGVQDVDLTRQIIEERFPTTGSGPQLERWARRYADYLQITAELLPSDDAYWDSEVGGSCGGEGYASCEAQFGTANLDELDPARELRILEAFQDRLIVEPRNADDDEKERIIEMMDCCFPGGAEYVVRASDQWIVRGSASGFRHRVVGQPVLMEDGTYSYPCRLDCSPAKTFFEGRAFEVTPESEVGDICHYDGRLEPNGEGENCIFDGLTSRFAIYAGESPSERDMTFAYDVLGGFSTLNISLTRRDTTVILPRSLTSIEGFGALGVVDSQDRGLMILSLDTLAVASPSPYF